MQRRMWTVFLAMLTTAAFWFTGSGLYHLYGYMRLNVNAPTTSIIWSVNKINGERFLLKGNYTYTFQGKTYSGESVVSYPSYRNHWTAETAIKEKSKKQIIWFSSFNPSYTSLEKNLPLKEFISAFVLWGILLYFVCLQNYISKVDHYGNRGIT